MGHHSLCEEWFLKVRTLHKSFPAQRCTTTFGDSETRCVDGSLLYQVLPPNHGVLQKQCSEAGICEEVLIVVSCSS